MTNNKAVALDGNIWTPYNFHSNSHAPANKQNLSKLDKAALFFLLLAFVGLIITWRAGVGEVSADISETRLELTYIMPNFFWLGFTILSTIASVVCAHWKNPPEVVFILLAIMFIPTALAIFYASPIKSEISTLTTEWLQEDMDTVLTAENLDESDKGVRALDNNGNIITIKKLTTGTLTTINAEVTAR